MFPKSVTLKFGFIYGVALLWFVFSCKSPTDSTDTNTAPKGMKLISAKGFTFSMGNQTGFSNEMPVHSVTFTYDFYMDTTEVTQADYESLMSITYTGYTAPVWAVPYGVGDNYPAYSLTWDDAVLYCNARSKSDGYDTVYSYDSIMGTPGYLCELEELMADLSKNGYRLPTEAEWEHACRVGTATDYYWGKEYDPYPSTVTDTAEISSYAVWCANSWNLNTSDDFGTHPVATKLPNAYGLYDMSGNLYEWCHDWYGSYTGDSQIDPTGPISGSWHVVRGGSWGNHAEYLRSANRTFYNPDYLYYFIGFRVMRRAE